MHIYIVLMVRNILSQFFAFRSNLMDAMSFVLGVQACGHDFSFSAHLDDRVQRLLGWEGCEHCLRRALLVHLSVRLPHNVERWCCVFCCPVVLVACSVGLMPIDLQRWERDEVSNVSRAESYNVAVIVRSCQYFCCD